MLRFNDLTKSSGDNIMGFCGYVVDTISGASPWIFLNQDSRLKFECFTRKTISTISTISTEMIYSIVFVVTKKMAELTFFGGFNRQFSQERACLAKVYGGC